jgi:two-component system response regulator
MTVPTVLLVEDDDDDVDVTLLAFKRAGLSNVAIARDGVEALQYLHGRPPEEAPPPLPKVVFLDLRMPRLDGFQVLKALRTHPRTAFLPVVVLTASREPRDLEESYAAGANSYVRKAIDVSEFDAIAEQLARYWLSCNEIAP